VTKITSTLSMFSFNHLVLICFLFLKSILVLGLWLLLLMSLLFGICFLLVKSV